MTFVRRRSNEPLGNHVLLVVAVANAGAETRSLAVSARIASSQDLPWVRVLAAAPLAREGFTNLARFRLLRAKTGYAGFPSLLPVGRHGKGRGE